MAVVIPDYEFSYNNRAESFRLPVNPQDPPEITTPGNSQNWTTTDVGTFKAIGAPGLQALTVDFWWPVQTYPFSRYQGYPTADKVREMLTRWQASKRPIRFIITGFLNDAFSIESLSVKQEIATGDVYFSIDLERYRFKEDANPSTGNNNRGDDSTDGEKESLYILHWLTKGETLCELAEKYLGDADRYQEIADENEIKDVGHPWTETFEDAEGKHGVWVKCEEGTPGYLMKKNQNEAGITVTYPVVDNTIPVPTFPTVDADKPVE